jgi:hypothetical protein
MYSKDLGVASVSFDLKPYFGRSDANNKLILADKDGAYYDYDGTGYVSYFRTRAYAMGQLDKWTKVTDVAGIFKPNSTSSPCLWVRAEQNWQQTWAEYHLSVPPSDSSRVFVESPESTSVRQGPANNDLVSLYVYDNLQQEVGWQLDLLVVGYVLEGER